MHLTLAGDVILSRGLAGSGDSEVVPVATRLRDADLTIANLECVFAGASDAPAAAACGPWLGAHPGLADELPWLGIAAVSRANNHAGDFGVAGMARTTAQLDRVGVRHAGVGEDLGRARAATFIERAGGRVALVSCASTFTLASMAVAGRAEVPGAAGLSPLRVRDVVTVTDEQADVLRGLVEALGPERAAAGVLPVGEHLARFGVSANDVISAQERLAAFGTTFEVGGRTGLRRVMAPADRAEILAVIESAAEVAEVVVLALHSHELGPTAGEPDPFVRTFVQDAVAAGAAVVAVGGPHRVRGIELHRGGLILYGLGSLVFQYDGFTRQPAPAYEAVGLARDAAAEQWLRRKFAGGRRGAPRADLAWCSALAELEFAGRRLVAARLVPLGHQRAGAHLGNPRLSDAATGRRTLSVMSELSARYGTVVDQRGVIRAG